MSVGRNDPCHCGSGKKYKQCCALKPAAATPVVPVAALLQQAQSHFQAQRWAQVEQCCQQVLAQAPNHTDALVALGVLALQLGRPQPGLDFIGKAIRVAKAPTDFMYYNQGLAQQALGLRSEALASLRRAVSLRPANVAALLGLGRLHEELGQFEEALTCFRKITTQQSAHAEAWDRQGVVLQLRGDSAAAEACWRKALALQPRNAEMLSNLAACRQSQGYLEEAVDLLQQALALKPDFPLALTNLGAALFALGRPEAAVACQRRLVERYPQVPAYHSNLLFGLLYQLGIGAAELLREHLAFSARFEAPFKAHWPSHGNSREPERRLRIGYVSADFRRHIMAGLFEPVLAAHDRGHFEIFCYYSNTVDDEVTARLRGLSVHWLACASLGDAELAARITADGIDILVDLNGHTALNRLPVFARKPAPVQVTWLGYPGSTGLSAMDYRLSDAFLDPPGTEASGYCETVRRLPVWAVFQPPACPPVSPLPALNKGYITLASLNNLAKVNGAVIQLWAELLKRLPTARLLICNAGEAGVRERLLREFAALGVAAERLRLQGPLPLDEYLALHHEVDLALDPFPFAGGVTNYQALWMGVPVVTLSGETTVSRQGAAILRGVGLEPCVAGSEAEYLERAMALAADLAGLAALRQGLRERMAGGVSAEQLTRALEQQYREMWRERC